MLLHFARRHAEPEACASSRKAPRTSESIVPLKGPSKKRTKGQEEQWRLINETGLLKQLPNPPRTTRVEDSDSEETPFAKEILNATLLVAPFTFLLGMVDM